MSQFVPLSRVGHAEHHWLPRRDFGFCATRPTVPILLAEIPSLLPLYTLAFTAANGRVQAVAVLGVDGATNLYVDGAGRWLCRYVPALLRGYPFALARNREGAFVLCIAEESLTQESNGLALFKSGGEFNDPIPQCVNFLQECERDNQATAKACQLLQHHGLLKPWSLRVPVNGQEVVEVAGLLAIDEAALNRLPPQVLGELRDAGALALAYGQLFSCQQVDMLAQRVRLLERMQQQSRQAKPQPVIGLDDIFPQEEVISFDFLGGGQP